MALASEHAFASAITNDHVRDSMFEELNGGMRRYSVACKEPVSDDVAREVVDGFRALFRDKFPAVPADQIDDFVSARVRNISITHSPDLHGVPHTWVALHLDV